VGAATAADEAVQEDSGNPKVRHGRQQPSIMAMFKRAAKRGTTTGTVGAGAAAESPGRSEPQAGDGAAAGGRAGGAPTSDAGGVALVHAASSCDAAAAAGTCGAADQKCAAGLERAPTGASIGAANEARASRLHDSQRLGRGSSLDDGGTEERHPSQLGAAEAAGSEKHDIPDRPSVGGRASGGWEVRGSQRQACASDPCPQPGRSTQGGPEAAVGHALPCSEEEADAQPQHSKQGRQPDSIRQQATLSKVLERASPSKHAFPGSIPPAGVPPPNTSASGRLVLQDPAEEAPGRLVTCAEELPLQQCANVAPSHVAHSLADFAAASADAAEPLSRFGESHDAGSARAGRPGEQVIMVMAIASGRPRDGEVQDAECGLQGVDVEEQKRIMRDIWLRQSSARPVVGSSAQAQAAAKRGRPPGRSASAKNEQPGIAVKQMRISAMLKGPKCSGTGDR
jgi:hypothetical protein